MTLKNIVGLTLLTTPVFVVAVFIGFQYGWRVAVVTSLAAVAAVFIMALGIHWATSP